MAAVSANEAGVQLDIRFSPFDSTIEPFLALVQSAKRSIFLVIYGFTLEPLIEDLIAKHQAGVEVGLILDHTQSTGHAERGQVQRLIAAGVPLLIGVSPDHGAIIHSKFVVVDERDVWTGSWNFSASAARESNNALMITGHPDVAAIFLRHYDRMRAVVLHAQSRLQLAGEAPDPLALADDASVDTTIADNAVPASSASSDSAAPSVAADAPRAPASANPVPNGRRRSPASPRKRGHRVPDTEPTPTQSIQGAA